MNRKWTGALALAALFNVAAIPSQGPDLARVMREKLEHAQKILEAVVTSDWVALESHSRELERLTHHPAWNVLNAPEYARYSRAFKQAIDALHEAAAQRDLEKTPQAYVSVTLRCVDCHRYLARARITKTRAFRPEEPPVAPGQLGSAR